MGTPLSLVRALALGALVAACAGPSAEETASTPVFDALDANGDDVLDQEEFARAFDRFDLDGDGTIDATESAAIVYEADEDRDGVVTPEEFRSIDLARLAADANLDGRLSRQELERYTRERREQLGPASAERGVRSELGPANRWLQFRF
ncbi:MAG: EF-hand domain-containing protein [Alphaproteobacteria bacterium]